MISEKTFKECIACLFKTFKSIEDSFLKASEADRKATYSIWHKALSSRLDDDQLRSGTEYMILNVENLYPGTNWIAMLCNYSKPKVRESAMDIVALVLDAASHYNIYDPYATSRYICSLKTKSPLAFAVGQRFGWADIHKAENMDILRGQLRMAAEEAISKANETGAIDMCPLDPEPVRISSNGPRQLCVSMVTKDIKHQR